MIQTKMHKKRLKQREIDAQETALLQTKRCRRYDPRVQRKRCLRNDRHREKYVLKTALIRKKNAPKTEEKEKPTHKEKDAIETFTGTVNRC